MATHHYPVNVEWKGSREGHGTLEAEISQTKVSLAVGKEFQGTGEGTNPEELLTSAVAACYSITFGILASNRKLPVDSFELKAVGEVEQNGNSLVFTALVLKPKIVLSEGADEAAYKLAEDLALKAESYCIISNAIRDKVAVSVEPDIE